MASYRNRLPNISSLLFSNTCQFYIVILEMLRPSSSIRSSIWADKAFTCFVASCFFREATQFTTLDARSLLHHFIMFLSLLLLHAGLKQTIPGSFPGMFPSQCVLQPNWIDWPKWPLRASTWKNDEHLQPVNDEVILTKFNVGNYPLGVQCSPLLSFIWEVQSIELD